MATPAQILANQQNAKLSTGPRTCEGKTASSANSLKHGLSAADPVLPHEDRDQFHQLIEQTRDEWTPKSNHEEFLVKQMAASRWKLDRVERLQVELLAAMSASESSVATGDAGIVQGLQDKNKANAFSCLERHRITLERSYYRALRELRFAQNERKALEAAQNEAEQEELARQQMFEAAARRAERLAKRDQQDYLPHAAYRAGTLALLNALPSTGHEPEQQDPSV